MALVTLKRNDYGAVLTDTLTINSTACNLTGATVYFCMTALDDESEFTAVKRAATIVDADAGQVSATILAADTATEGDYRQEWEVVYPSPAQTLTFPNDSYNTIRIIPDLG